MTALNNPLRNLIAGAVIVLAASLSVQAAPPPSPISNAEMRALLDREIAAWAHQDFSLAAGDWLPDAELVSPGGHIPKAKMQATITDYFKSFRDCKVTIQNVFVSADGTYAAVEWDWDVTRKRDNKRGLTHDAIIVELVGNKIKSWREYFDLGDSVDANP